MAFPDDRRDLTSPLVGTSQSTQAIFPLHKDPEVSLQSSSALFQEPKPSVLVLLPKHYSDLRTRDYYISLSQTCNHLLFVTNQPRNPSYPEKRQRTRLSNDPADESLSDPRSGSGHNSDLSIDSEDCDNDDGFERFTSLWYHLCGSNLSHTTH